MQSHRNSDCCNEPTPETDPRLLRRNRREKLFSVLLTECDTEKICSDICAPYYTEKAQEKHSIEFTCRIENSKVKQRPWHSDIDQRRVDVRKLGELALVLELKRIYHHQEHRNKRKDHQSAREVERLIHVDKGKKHCS